MNTTTAIPHTAEGRRSIRLLSSDGEPQVTKFLGQPSQPNHIVQFYQSDSFLCDNVAHFIAAGVAGGEPTIVIAAAAHRASFRQRLEDQAIDLSRARAMGWYTELDADELLTQFMVGSLPDPARFHEVLGPVFATAQAIHPDHRVRTYGEMVDRLWAAGNRNGALRLEELWNELGRRQSFSLLCASTMRSFEDAADSTAFEAIRDAHSHVIPAEGYTAVGSADARLRAVALLQQRAVSLEHEIARRKQLEDQLREALLRETAARAEAERTIRFNELFAGTLRHELRNPLNAILMNAHYLVRSNQGDGMTAAATRIASSSQRMSRMIEQLLDFTMICLGDGLVPDRIPLDLRDLCNGIRTGLEAANPGAAIAVVSRGDVTSELDFDRVLQVLSNVIGNAVHHGSPDRPVTVDADGTNADSVVVLVNNAGVVAPDVLPVLFEPFRAAGKGQHTRGLGLGLYITRQIIAAHGGTISVTSNETDGTTFRIELPRSTG